MPRFPGDVVDRSFEFGVRVLKMVAEFPAKSGFYRVLDQIAASSTSIAANLEEAQGAYSRTDFIHAVNIARKEARETLVRLKMLAKCGIFAETRFQPMIQEADAIVAILTAIMKKTKAQNNNSLLATRHSQLASGRR